MPNCFCTVQEKMEEGTGVSVQLAGVPADCAEALAVLAALAPLPACAEPEPVPLAAALPAVCAVVVDWVAAVVSVAWLWV